MNAHVTVFTVSPIADPARGGRWVSIQLWAGMGTAAVRQLAELKTRLQTPDGSDPTAEVEELTRGLVAIAREHKLAGIARRDSVVLSTTIQTES